MYPALVNHDDGVGFDGKQILYDGTGQAQSLIQCVFFGAPNNWVTRNACVKVHAAREKFYSSQGIKKSERGSYDHTIRYGLESTDSFLTPQKGIHSIGGADGAVAARSDMTMGTWDQTTLIYPDDAGGATLHLCGGHDSSDEENATAFTKLCAGELYLTSRGTVPADSNLETSTTPYKESILQKMMFDGMDKGTRDDLRALVRGQQDNPPYDISLATNDSFSLVELGRLQFIAGQGGSATCIIEAPLGMFDMRSILTTSEGHMDGTVTANLEVNVELLGLSEM